MSVHLTAFSWHLAPVGLTKAFNVASRPRARREAGADDRGNSCGVMPTAIASANSTESMIGRRNSRFLFRMTAVSLITTRSNR
jgi:hypothetical protein